MSIIDIRCNEPEQTNKIRFADVSTDYYQATIIKREYTGKVSIQEEDGNTSLKVNIMGREHAENLIKAMKKAIDMGWLD